MWNKLCAMVSVLALLGSASACGVLAPNNNEPPGSEAGSMIPSSGIAAPPSGDEPLPPEEPALPPLTAPVLGEEPAQDSPGPGSQSMLDAYKAILEDICVNHKFPDGEDRGYSDPLTEDANVFAIYDVDQDGKEELIVSYTTSTLYAGMAAFVFAYDEASGTISEEFSDFPLLTFFDNGVIQADWSHNQGKAGDRFWPYTFWRYDAASDIYYAAEMADAWDMSLVDDGFPKDADTDGDGVVYYIMQYGNYDTSHPVDGETYQQWRDSYVGEAQPVELPFMALTENNIQTAGAAN